MYAHLCLKRLHTQLNVKSYTTHNHMHLGLETYLHPVVEPLRVTGIV